MRRPKGDSESPNPTVQRVAVAEKLSALRTEAYFRERASRADIDEARKIMSRAGKGNPPLAGDELP